MTITAAEKNRGQTGGVGNWEITYVVIDSEGAMEPQDAQDAANDESPDNIGELWRSDIRVDDFITTPNQTIAFVTVSYGSPEAEALGGAGGGATFEFSYQAESAHIYRALATRAFKTTGESTSTATSIHPHIKLVHGDTGWTPEGIDLPPGNTTHIFRRRMLVSAVGPTYQATVRALLGGVNNGTLGDAVAGTVRFVSCSSQVTGNYADFTWGFQYADNVSETVAGIAYEKLGHEYAWDYTRTNKVDATNKIVVPDITAIIVQQVFPSVNLSALGVF